MSDRESKVIGFIAQRKGTLAIQGGRKLVEIGKDANQATGKTGLHLLRVQWV